MRAELITLLLVAGLWACSSDTSSTGGRSSTTAGGTAGYGAGGGSAGSGATTSGTGGSSTGGGGAGGTGGGGGGPMICDTSDPQPPPGSVLWPDVLSGTGADTLGGHGHDDGKGPVGFCTGTPSGSDPYYAIIAVGFETDEDINSDNDQNDALPADFYTAAPFVGVGESGGRINIYAEVLDENGVVLSGSTAPNLRYRLTTGGTPQSLPLDNKPANEFQTNFPMVGGGVTYELQVDGASDRVFNMRLPVNHHVTYAVVFQRRP